MKQHFVPRPDGTLRDRAESYLRAAADQWRRERPGFHYAGPADFLLQHGEWFTNVQLMPGGQPGKCYGTSIVFAVRYGERYFEGYAIQPLNNFRGSDLAEALIPHAWTVHPENPDTVHDWTWPVAGSIYVGTEFSVERADDCTWNGDACVLWDEHRGFPLYRQPWHGEPPDLIWPPSDRLDIARDPTPEKVLAWQQANPEATAPGHLTSHEALILPRRDRADST